MIIALSRSIVLSLAIASYWCFADSAGMVEFEHYNIHYSVVNSTAIPPKVAAIHNIKRAARQGLVTVVVVPKQRSYNGIEVLIGGDLSNLLQQSATLNFKPIKETGTVYYIAPFRFDHRELLHFTVHVKAPLDKYSNSINFSHALYAKGAN